MGSSLTLPLEFVCYFFYHACAGCGLRYSNIASPLLNALIDAFKVTDLRFDTLVSQGDCRPNGKHFVLAPPLALFTECTLTRCCASVATLRFNQNIHFCHRVLYWNFRLQCNVTRLRPPPPLPFRLHRYLVLQGASALSLTASQHHRLLCLSGHTLLLLRLLMYTPGRCNMHRLELHTILKRICGLRVAAHLFDIGSPCVQIRTLGRSNDFSHSLLVNLSDSVGKVKAKFESIIGCRSWLTFYFAGRQLPEHLSLAECGIKPHDTIDMAFDDSGMEIFVFFAFKSK